MKILRPFILAIGLFALPVAASAAPTLFLKAGTRHITDDRLALVSTSDAIVRTELGVGLPVTEHLGLELAGTFSGSSAPLFAGVADAGLSLWGVQGTARLDFPLLPWLAAFGRGGLALEAPTLWVQRGSHDLSQTRLVPTALGTAGAEMSIPLNPEAPKGYLVISIEGGYLLTPTTDFDGLHRDRDPDDEPLPTQPIPVGSLNVSGWLFQVGASLRL